MVCKNHLEEAEKLLPTRFSFLLWLFAGIYNVVAAPYSEPTIFELLWFCCFGRFENDEIEPGPSTRGILSLLATRLKVLNLRNDFFI